MATAAVDALDVHAKSHYDLIVTVGASVVLHPHFNCLVRDLDHLEVVFHLFFEKKVNFEKVASLVKLMVLNNLIIPNYI